MIRAVPEAVAFGCDGKDPPETPSTSREDRFVTNSICVVAGMIHHGTFPGEQDPVMALFFD
jgi:hypothetical protein